MNSILTLNKLQNMIEHTQTKSNTELFLEWVSDKSDIPLDDIVKKAIPYELKPTMDKENIEDVLTLDKLQKAVDLMEVKTNTELFLEFVSDNTKIPLKEIAKIVMPSHLKNIMDEKNIKDERIIFTSYVDNIIAIKQEASK